MPDFKMRSAFSFCQTIVLAILILVSSFNVSGAQTSAALERDQLVIDSFENKLNTLKLRYDSSLDDEEALIDIRADADELLPKIADELNKYELEITSNKERLTTLGEPPAEGESPEAQAVTLERENLTKANALQTVFVGKLENLIAETDSLIFDIGILRRDMFVNALFKRVDFADFSFADVRTSFFKEFAKFRTKATQWLSFVWTYQKSDLFLSLGLSFLAGLVIFWGGYRIFGSWIFNYGQQPEPSFAHRLTSAFWSAAIPTIAVAAFGASTYFLLLEFGVLRFDFAPLFARLVITGVALVLALKLAWLILGPWMSGWRLVNITDRSAISLFLLVVVLFIIKAISFLGIGVREILDLPLQGSVLQAVVETVLVALILIAASRLKPLIPPEGDAHSSGLALPLWISAPLLIVGALLIIICFIGYVALAAFAASQIVITGALLVIIYFGLLSGKSIMVEGAFAASPIGKLFSNWFQPTEGNLNRLGLLFGILTYIIVLMFGVSMVLLQWGFRPQELSNLAYQLVTQVRVGGITISFVNIFIGFVLFAIGYLATKRFQRWLDGNVLTRGQVELGVRNSIRKIVGYFGIAIAAMIAISAAGFDLSSLALVAGALSLGIGFGLQTIVSNFVSGLILLAERPFKAGDWVETSSVEGIVKEISVRATEIETFSRKSVIVPNSELVNGAVGNWTHRNTIGRIEVMVGVSYDNSPQKIIDLLIEIANENSNILRAPAPSVEFVDFGASSLDFRIRGFLADIDKGLVVRNELRVAIFERFKTENIEIPFPQQDVYLHNADKE